jgi:hypothetical protein
MKIKDSKFNDGLRNTIKVIETFLDCIRKRGKQDIKLEMDIKFRTLDL